MTQPEHTDDFPTRSEAFQKEHDEMLGALQVKHQVALLVAPFCIPREDRTFGLVVNMTLEDLKGKGTLSPLNDQIIKS